MTQMMQSLPYRQVGEVPAATIIVHSEGLGNEGNICLESDVVFAQNHNWLVMSVDKDYNESLYAGEPTAAQELSAPTLALYPNPASDFVTLSGVDAQQEVYLLSMEGQVLQHTKAEGGVVRLDVRTLAEGVYVVRCGTKVYSLQVRHL